MKTQGIQETFEFRRSIPEELETVQEGMKEAKKLSLVGALATVERENEKARQEGRPVPEDEDWMKEARVFGQTFENQKKEGVKNLEKRLEEVNVPSTSNTETRSRGCTMTRGVTTSARGSRGSSRGRSSCLMC